MDHLYGEGKHCFCTPERSCYVSRAWVSAAINKHYLNQSLDFLLGINELRTQSY